MSILRHTGRKFKMKNLENNKVNIAGVICSDFKYSHTLCGEKFYIADLEVERTSGKSDIIPIMVSDRMIKIEDLTGVSVEITGQFRSYNKHIDGKSKLLLTVFALEIEVLENFTYNNNNVELIGYICKEPIYRTTPLGKEIADVFVAVNRYYGKSDYIPCICWGRNARYVGNLDIGTKISIAGRVQSRTFLKKIDEETTEERVAYELSASKVEVVEESEE
jgi:primosomal replication protein N